MRERNFRFRSVMRTVLFAVLPACASQACSSSNTIDTQPATADDAGGYDAPADIVQGQPETGASDGKACAPGTVAQDCPTGLGCIEGICGPCTASKQCGGLVCAAGQCNACKDTECKDAYSGYFTCEQGRCVSTACADDVDCLASGQVCKNYQCAACSTSYECVNSKAYGSGHQCLAGQCSNGDCTSHADCPSDAPICGTNKQCRGCQESQECLTKVGVTSGFVCDPQKGLCIAGDCLPDKSPCGTPADKVCDANKCRDCTGNVDCQAVFGSGFLCISGHCLAGECVGNSDCDGGQRICDPSTHKCRDCLTAAQECGSGMVCGTDGKCHTGQCYPAAVGCCDPDGNLRLSSYKCDPVAVKTEYRCESSDCGADAQQRAQYRFCSGTNAACDDSNLQFDPWTTIQNCGNDDVCESDESHAQCTNCQNGCGISGGAAMCFGFCNPSDVCCDASGNYLVAPCCGPNGIPLAAGTICDTTPVSSEYQCGTSCGGDRQIRVEHAVCSGTDSSCGPLTAWSTWKNDKACATGYCDQATKDCVECANGCNPATVQCNVCPANQCTIGGKCYASGDKLNDWDSNCSVCNLQNPGGWTQTACSTANTVSATCDVSQGTCSYVPAAGYCAIGGRVLAAGTRAASKGAPGYCFTCNSGATSWAAAPCALTYDGSAAPAGINTSGTAKSSGVFDWNYGSIQVGIVAVQGVMRTAGIWAVRVAAVSINVATSPPIVGTNRTWRPSSTTWEGPGAGVLGPTPGFEVACPSGQIAVGLQGRTSGGVLSAIGLLCATPDQIHFGDHSSPAFASATTIEGNAGTAVGPAWCSNDQYNSSMNWSYNDSGFTTLSLPCSATFGCCHTGASNPPAAIGNVDVADATSVQGWACDRLLPGASASVELYFDGPVGTGKKYPATSLASLPSEYAVNSACGGGVAHRFQFPLTEANLQSMGVGSGTHSVHVYGQVAPDPAGQLSNSPISVTVP